MSSQEEEKLILPEPLKVKPSIAKYLDKLEYQMFQEDL